MRRIYTAVLLCILSVHVLGHRVTINQGEPVFELTNDSWTGLSFIVGIPSWDIQTLKTADGLFTEVTLDGANTLLDVGEPQLPVLNRLIEVPYGAEYSVNISNAAFTDYDLTRMGYGNPVMPYQGSQVKTWNGPRPFYIDQQLYATDSFISEELVSVADVGQMRGVDVARVSVSPFWYNPATNTLRVWHSIEVDIAFQGGSPETSGAMKAKVYSPAFEPIHRLLWNYREPESAHSGAENISTAEPVRMVIVADTMFRTTLKPFITWKRRKGFNITEAYMQDPAVGTTSASIRNYLQGLYNNASSGNPAPSFVLFVGDVAQLPPFPSGAHVTDRDFCEYTNDALPDVYYGRFSAENVSQLQVQISKTLEYEQYLMQDPSFLNKVVLIAGADGTFGPTHGNGQINYGTSNYFNTAHNLTTDAYLYPASSGNATVIRQKIGAGVSFANYTAHGYSAGWADPSFNTSHVALMNNPGKYPLMIGNACLTSKFDATSPCFGEELLRASDKGAIAYIGASDNTYWDEDFYWAVGVGTITANPTYAGTTAGLYDLFVHDHNEPFSQWAMTTAQIMFAGNLAVTQAGSAVNYYWEIYHVLGDPSLMPFLNVPPAMQVSYPQLLPLGLNTITVNAEPFAYVAISNNDTLHGAALADSLGVAVVSLDPFTSPCQADVVVTAQNRQPWTGTLTVASPNGPFLVYANHSIDDNAGNNNGNADFGETILLDMDISNLTAFGAVSVDCRLRSTDANISLIDTTHTASTVPGNGTISVSGMFSFSVNQAIIDGHTVSFTLHLEDQGGNSWSSMFNIVLNAPVITILDLQVSDTGGNGNGRLDAGESADLVVRIANLGHADAGSSTLTVTSSQWEVPILSGSPATFTSFDAGDTLVAVLPTSVSSQAPNGLVTDISIDAQASIYGAQNILSLMVGQVDEDWESGGFGNFSWVNAGNLGWTADSATVYEGTYSARSGAIGDQEESTLSISMNVISDDSISFYCMVSSEEYYDYLRFYIDGVQAGEWSGIMNWHRVAYPVSMGQHTFTWKYIKDYYLSNGQDAAWIDYIIFPPNDMLAGLEDEEPEISVRVWPNPASTELNVRAPTESDNLSVTLSDALGRQIRSEWHSGLTRGLNTVQLNLSGLRAGTYFLTVDDGHRRQSLPVIIAK